MKKNLFLGMMLFINYACLSQTDLSQNLITPAQLEKAMAVDTMLLIDVRTAVEFDGGHIDSAIHVDYLKEPQFINHFEKINKDTPLLLYCRSGNRSARARVLLKKLGFNTVYDLQGGYKNWLKNQKEQE